MQSLLSSGVVMYLDLEVLSHEEADVTGRLQRRLVLYTTHDQTTRLTHTEKG